MLLAGAGCTASSGSDAADLGGPSFSQVTDEALRATAPKSEVGDLVPPAEEGGAWRVVGSVTDPTSGRPQAAVWRSGDGRAWERQDIEGGGDAGASMAAGTYVGDRLVVVGEVENDSDADRSDAAVWQPDGEGWALSTPGEMGGEHDQWAFDVVAGDGGMLVAGGEIAWGDVRPRLWFSADGESWASVDGGPGGVFDETGEESVQAIAPVGDGFVAVGWRDVDGELDGMAWYSADGRSWEAVDAPSLAGGGRQSLQSVTTIDGTVVAGGFVDNSAGPAQPVVWRSDGGQSWGAPSGGLPLNQDNRNASRDLSVRSITVSGDRLLAAGGNQWRPHLWISDNQGSSWTALPSPIHGETTFADGVAVEDAATVGNVTLALGSEPTVMQFEGDRWLDRTGDAFPTGGAQPAASSVVVGENLMLTAGYRVTGRSGEERNRTIGNVWLRSGDDLTEVRPSNEDDGPGAVLEAGAITDVARFNGGYVAVGVEDFASASRRTLQSEPQGVIWTSENGQDWGRRMVSLNQISADVLAVIDGDPATVAAAAVDVLAGEPLVSVEPMSGSGTRSLEAVAPIGNGFIAVGSVYRDAGGGQGWDTDPIVAVSGDGQAVTDESGPLGLNGAGTQRLHDVCTFEGRAITVGSDDSSGSTDVAVRVRDGEGWHEATAADDSFGGSGAQQAYACSAGEDGFLVVGSDSRSGNTDARVWFSADGTEWELLTGGALGGSGDQEAVAVAPVPDGDGGWLVGGSDATGDESDGALWRVLPSGEIARRDHGEPSFGGPGIQTVSDVAVNGNRATVVGQDRTSVAMWVTSDLDR